MSQLQTSDRFLNKAIKRLLLLSLSVHLGVFLFTTSKGTQALMDQALDYENQFFQSTTDANHSTIVTPTLSSTSPSEHGFATEDPRPPTKTPSIPLVELIQTNPNPNCMAGKFNKTLVESIILDEAITHPPGRRIPKIIHITTKSRCLLPKFVKNIRKWEMKNYSIYIHDDEAVIRLLNKYWPGKLHSSNYVSTPLHYLPQ